MIAIVKDEEIQRIGYYAVIPATVLFNERLKPNEKLLYALITALSNKEGYCYASNKYLGEKLGVDPVTVSRWITDLRRNNYVFVDIMRNEKKEIICRRIFPNDVPYRLNNQYPYIRKNQEGIDDEVRKAVLAAADYYKSLGAELVDCSMPSLKYAVAAYYLISSAEASSNLSRFDGIKYGHRSEEGENFAELISKGNGIEIICT